MRNKPQWGILAMSAASACLSCTVVHAGISPITGFGNGSSFASNYSIRNATKVSYNPATTTNTGTTNPPFFSPSGQLTLTNGANLYQATSVYDTTAENITNGFVASFTYNSIPNTGDADGFDFVVQNQGLTALGPYGNGRGLQTGLGQVSIGVEYYPSIAGLYTSENSNPVEYDHTNPAGPVSSSGVDFATAGSSSPISVTITYNGLKTLTFVAVQGTHTYTYTDTLANSIATDLADNTAGTTALGAGNAYIGFTGGTGSQDSTQTLTNFSFGSVPEPTTLALLALGGAAALLLGKRKTKAFMGL